GKSHQCTEEDDVTCIADVLLDHVLNEFCKPLVVIPGVACRREGERIHAGYTVRFEDELAGANMPAIVRVGWQERAPGDEDDHQRREQEGRVSRAVLDSPTRVTRSSS